MSDTLELMGCTFEEDVRSEPIPKGKYRGILTELVLVDPVLEGWEPRSEKDDMNPRLQATFQIEATAEGLETELKGRFLRRQKVDLRPGSNPKTGEPYRKVAADLLRVVHRLGPKGSVKGLTLFPAATPGLSREEAVAEVNKHLEQYAGLPVVFSVRNYKGPDGEWRDVLGGILVPDAD